MLPIPKPSCGDRNRPYESVATLNSAKRCKTMLPPNGGPASIKLGFTINAVKQAAEIGIAPPRARSSSTGGNHRTLSGERGVDTAHISQHADVDARFARFLRQRTERPSGCRASNNFDEISPVHATILPSP